MKQLKQIKEGEFFRLSKSESAPVWVRGYLRQARTGGTIIRTAPYY